jgi:thymidylate kinase
MFIIVEGPKCCGKTTLCNRLAKEYGGEVIHFPTDSVTGRMAFDMLGKCSSEEEYNLCQNLMEQDIDETLSSLDSSKLWILDRSFISNAIYRSSDHIMIKDKYMKIIEKSMLIVLLASIDNLNEWIKLRTDKPLNHTEKIKLEWSNERFHRVAEMLECLELSEVNEIKVGKWFIRRK